MNKQIERWIKNKMSEGWRQSIASTVVENLGVTIKPSRGRGFSYIPAFIEKIEVAYQQLSEREKEIIQSEYIHPGTQKEKSQNLNISHQCFRDRLCRARKKLLQ